MFWIDVENRTMTPTLEEGCWSCLGPTSQNPSFSLTALTSTHHRRTWVCLDTLCRHVDPHCSQWYMDVSNLIREICVRVRGNLHATFELCTCI